jgi:type I restriction enzyme S subunit
MTPTLTPYPSYKDSGVTWLGQVPEHWETCRLKSRLIKNDSGVWRDQHDPAGTIVLRSTEQTVSGGWKIENPARLHLTQEEREAYLLHVGDLVVTKSSGSPDHIGKTSLVTEDVSALGCAFSNFMQRLRLGDNTNPKMIWYYLNSRIGREQLVLQSTTTTGLGNLNGKILGNCVFALPPLPEQTAIVRFLDYMDRRIRRVIRARQRQIKLLEEYRQALIHQAVTGQIGVRTGKPYPAYKDSGVPWLGKVPEHWEVLPLCGLGRPKQVTNCVDRELLSVYLHRGVVRFADVPDKRTNPTSEDLTKYQAVDYGDFVLNNQQAWRGSVGVSKYSGIVSPAYLVLALNGRLDTTYADRLLQDRSMVDQYLVCSKGVGSIQRNLYWPHLRRVAVPVPPNPEQTAIVEYLDAQTAKIDAAISVTRREIALLREYRERLIADVVTGKVDVREVAARLPEELPEEENDGPEPSDEAETFASDGEDEEAIDFDEVVT